MATFATETAVRLRFHWNDTMLVPSELIVAALGEAHNEIIRRIDPVYLDVPVDEALEAGETALAGAGVARALAANDAARQKHLAVGGSRVQEGARFDSLLRLAEIAETHAWYLLEPYLRDLPGRAQVGATDSVPVIGED